MDANKGEQAKMAVTWKLYRADNAHMESKVGIVNKLLIAAPFFVLATVGVKARAAGSTFEFMEGTAKQNSAITAYQSVVAETEKLPLNAADKCPERVRKIAMEWIEGARKGELQPLGPIVFEDSSRDGVKFEIVHANTGIGEDLNMLASRELHEGKPWLAAQDDLLAARASQVTEYSDFPSLAVCTMVQRKAFSNLRYVMASLTPGQRQKVTSQVSLLRPNKQLIEDIAVRTRQQFLQYQLRHGLSLSQVTDVQHWITPKELVSESTYKTKDNLVKPTAHDEFAIELMNDARLGFCSAQETAHRIDDIVNRSPIYSL